MKDGHSNKDDNNKSNKDYEMLHGDSKLPALVNVVIDPRVPYKKKKNSSPDKRVLDFQEERSSSLT